LTQAFVVAIAENSSQFTCVKNGISYEPKFYTLENLREEQKEASHPLSFLAERKLLEIMRVK
jgi:hypothetical protein